MKYVININIVDVLAGDYVNLIVPFPVQRFQRNELIFLILRKRGEVVEYDGGVLQLDGI